MKTIYIDFDDVLCETALALAVVIEREFGKAVAYDDIHSFDLAKSFNLNETESEKLFDIFHDDKILAEIIPTEDATDAMQELHSQGINIHIVTGRPPSTCKASQKWLKAHKVPYHKISFVDKYGRNHAYIDGVDILTLNDLKKLKFDAAIDDSPIAISFLAKHTENPIIVFDRPWNADLRELENSPQITRCKTWKDVLEQLNGLTNNHNNA